MSLTPQQLGTLSQLIDAMQALPAAQRSGWLQTLDEAHAALKPHLLRLLAADAGTGDATAGDAWWQPMAAAARRGAQAAQDALHTPAAGTQVGPYRLRRPLGEGGMGVVWLAERTDGELRREVALKLPLAGPAARRWAERFERERDLLARLAHPNIARLYDAGHTATGQPWLAMEVVAGEPITAHVQRCGLGLDARLALFQQVLAAVQFAHAQLVLHRDLKPSNILVDAGGQVHLLDFGIALPLDAPRDSADPLTEVGQALWTPDYAAPEQLRGEPLGIAVDVHALGVVLFELLCGERPFRPARPGRAALEEAVLNDDPPRPSAVVREPALARRLRGDLDTIVLKALRKAPAERYASVEAFALDVQRFLAGAPVLAHPDSLGYRWRKGLVRHRVAVAAGGAAALALLAGSGVALWQAGAARHEAQQAAREARKARAVQDFLVGLFNANDPAQAQGHEQTVRELLANGERDLQGRLAAEPELRAAVGGALVDIYNKLEDPQHALPLAQARAELLLRTAGPASADYAVALYTVGVAQYQLRQAAAALDTLGRAEAALAPHAARHREEWLDLLRTKAQSLGQLGRDAEAVAVQNALIPQEEAFFGAGDWEVLFEKSGLALHLVRAGDRARALAVAGELLPRLAAAPPERGVEAAVMRANLGGVLRACGEPARAVAALTGVAEALDRLQGPHTTSAALAQATLGQALEDRGEPAAALAHYRDFAGRVGRAFGNDAGRLAQAQALQIAPLLWLGRVSEAAAAAQAAGAESAWAVPMVALFQGTAPPPMAAASAPRDRARAEWIAAAARLAAGDAPAAARQAEAAARQWLALPAHDAVDERMAAKARLTQVLALAADGQGPAALALLDATLAPMPTGHPLRQAGEIVRARALQAAGRAAEAQALERSARDALQREAGIVLPQRLLLLP